MIKYDETDALLSNSVESIFIPDADFGAYLYSEKLYVGLSLNQLIQMKLNGFDSDRNRLTRHYNLMGGYKMFINKQIDLEPSLLMKATANSPMQLDINTRVIYKSNYWAGISYRSNSDFAVLLGCKIDQFVVGYMFDYSFSKLKRISNGSHEIMIGINISDKSGSRLI
jgi:type IX secretion system PorP/SprF family membrane protein